jgi:hypothetical protein
MPFTHESAARYGAKGGRVGGRSTSEAKKAHARANGAKGGRPRLKPEKFKPNRKLARLERIRLRGAPYREWCMRCRRYRTYIHDTCEVCGHARFCPKCGGPRLYSQEFAAACLGCGHVWDS